MPLGGEAHTAGGVLGKRNPNRVAAADARHCEPGIRLQRKRFGLGSSHDEETS